jgi:lysophospholipase L1-like esterase
MHDLNVFLVPNPINRYQRDEALRSRIGSTASGEGGVIRREGHEARGRGGHGRRNMMSAVPRRLLPFVLLLGVLVWVLAASGAVAATITPATPITRGSEYLALGDSVTFGYQEPNTVPAPDYHDPASLPGYPEHLGSELHVLVTNLACPGETSGSLINVHTLSNGCENAYRKLYPLHAKYAGAQLSYALAFLRRHPRVRLVSLMIGANDIFLCEKNTPSHCLSAADQNKTIRTVARNVKTIVSAIRSQGRYKGQVAIVTYYSTDFTSTLITGVIKKLNSAVVTAAKPYKIEIADGFDQFRVASIKYARKPCLAGLITQLNGTVGDCGVHPTYAGSALLAEAVLSAIRLPGDAVRVITVPPPSGGLG